MPGESTVRLARYDVDIDSYRSAKILLDRFGSEASRHAMRRMEVLLAEGDEEGAAAWVDIAFAIDEIRRPLLPGEAAI